MDVFGWQMSLRANYANDRPKMPKSLGFENWDFKYLLSEAILNTVVQKKPFFSLN